MLPLLVVAACATGGDVARIVAPTQTAIGNSKPVPAVARATRMPVQGIDVSEHDGDIDWHSVKRAGITFAYLKTTEGGDVADDRFDENWKAAGAAGIHRGAYHFMYWCRAADQQARFFLSNVPNDPEALPPVLDLEWNDASPTCPGAFPASKAVPMIRTLLAAMEARTGKRPIIYTDVTFYRDILSGGAFADYPLWLRSVAAEPAKLYPGRPYTYWQFSSTGRVPGIAGDVDRNVFNGSADDWDRWLVQAGVVKPEKTATAAAAAAPRT